MSPVDGGRTGLSSHTRSKPHHDSAREREFYRYYNPEGITKVISTVASSSHDNILTSFAQLAALRLNTKRSLISLFSRHQQHVIAEATRTLSLQSDIVHDLNDALWLGTTTITKESGVCGILSLDREGQGVSNDVVIIPDLAQDERFQNAHFVTHFPFARFYAAVPIISPKGYEIGAYCVIDDLPRGEGLPASEIQFMKDMAITVMSYLELARTREEHRRGERMVRGLGSFHEGRSTLRNWRPRAGIGPGNDDCTHEASRVARGGEGQLNERQQASQLTKDLGQEPFYLDAQARTEGYGHDQNTNTEMIIDQKEDASTVSAQRVVAPSSAIASMDSKPNDRDLVSNPSLQEDLLSLGVRGAFARASNIVRESIEVEGSIFIDAAIGSYSIGGLVQDGRKFSTTDVNSSSGSYGRGSSSGSDSQKSCGQKSNKSAASLEQEKMCGVLGFSTSSSSSIDGDIMSKLHGLIPEALVKGLLKRYPRGKIFHFSEDGQASSGSSSESHHGYLTGDDTSITSVTKPRTKRKVARRYSRLTDAQEIVKIFPGARSIGITPLWDSHRNRWFSLGVVWTTNPKRVLTIEGDLSFLSSFGNTIMAEVARLDALMAAKAKTDLLGSISHELRSPLHGILGSVEILEDSISSSLQANLVNSIETCGRTLLDTIDHLLDYTRINHSSHLQRQQRNSQRHNRIDGSHSKRTKSEELMMDSDAGVDLCAVTEEVLTAVSAGYNVPSHTGSAGRASRPLDSSYADDTSGVPAPAHAKTLKNVAVSIDIASNPNWCFSTQAGAWRRIVMNLFSNCLKYTTDGFINVALRSEPLPPKDGRNWSRVILSVSDSGRGMSAEYLHGRLFTPFAQEDHLSPGTGLGLSIIQHIIRSLGGEIEVRSNTEEVRHGTEVTVSILMMQSIESSATIDSGLIRSASHVTSGLKVCLSALDREDAVTRELELSALRRICSEWYDMTVISAVDTLTVPDLYIILETRANQSELISGKLFEQLRKDALLRGARKLLSVIVICRTPTSTNNLERLCNKSERIRGVELICQPCGPRKLGNALLRCLKQGVDLESGRLTSCSSPDVLPSPEVVGAAIDRPEQVANGYTETRMSPLSEPESKPTSPDSPSSPYMLPSHAGPFLLVDDNHINLQVLRMFMKKHRYTHATAQDGLEALETYKNAANTPFPFNTIFMDISMPVMDGLTATHLIRTFERENNVHPPAFIIMLTGLGSASVQQDAHSSGANMLLTKPVRLKELSKILEDLKSSKSSPSHRRRS